VDVSVEQNILTASIISTKFLEEMYPLYDKQYLTNSFITKVMNWVLDYFDRFGEAPKQHIQDIFTIEKQTLEDAELDLIQSFLENLSQKYTEDQGINEAYVLHQTMEYFRRRELEVRIANASALLQIGRLDKAEEEISHMKKVMKLTSNWVNPFDTESITKVFDESNQGIFKFPGKFGELLGEFERGWFVAFLAPFKRGKCVAEGTIITMVDGHQVPIEKVTVGDIAVSMDAKFNLVPNKVIDVLFQGEKDVYKVKTYTGREIEVTINHPFYGAKGWTKLENLRVGDHIAVPKKNIASGNLEYPEYKLKLLAYLIADGSLVPSDLTYTKNDFTMQNDFKQCVFLMGDSVSYVKNCLADTFRIISGKNSKYSDSSKTKQWLQELNLLGKRSKDKFIPEFIFSLNNHHISIFLNALFSGDGSIWKDRNCILIEYSSASHLMIKQIQHLLTRFGIISVIKSKQVKGVTYWSLNVLQGSNINLFLEKIGFSFEKNKRTKEILNATTPKRCQKSNVDCVPFEVIKELIPSSYKWRTSAVQQSYKKQGSISNTTARKILPYYKECEQFQNLINGDIFYDEITEISLVGKKQTYDLTMETEANPDFVANDFVVHNTWFLMEAAVLGALSGLKTVFISLEMQEKAVNQRIYKRITAYGEEGRDHFIPVFDCRNNQLGLCIREERKGKGALAEKEEGIPTYSPEIQHTVCTACRYAKNSDYSPMTWFEPVDKPKFIEKNVRKGIKAFAKMYGDNIRVKCYPRFSAGIDDIERDLDILEQTEGFLPDMIVIDYVDILKVKNGNGGHKDLDEIWKESASLFARRFALGFSASQGTRGSLYKSDMDQTDLAEWIGKLGHVDAFVALNQTKKEKLLGMIRAALMAHRHKEFSEDENVILLQALSLGQTHLDSHIK
jgi:intein/homing endonuclease